MTFLKGHYLGVVFIFMLLSPINCYMEDDLEDGVARELENPIFIGVTNATFVPSILKGTTFTNTIYGFVNRTGTIVAGVALLGLSGWIL